MNVFRRHARLGRFGVASDVRERLGDDEVRRRLDLRVVPSVGDVDRDRHRRPLGEGVDRGA